ncbi:MAG: hypothetical protein ACR2IS_01115, partial [Nitrososphaeraceae archaeon]
MLCFISPKKLITYFYPLLPHTIVRTFWNIIKQIRDFVGYRLFMKCHVKSIEDFLLTYTGVSSVTFHRLLVNSVRKVIT